MKKIKISELPLYQSLVGLFTIGTDAQNRSVKVSLEFIETATNQAVQNAQTATSNAVAATEQAQAAKTAAQEAAALANEKAALANEKAGAANDAASTAINAAGQATTAKTNAETATTNANAAKDAANAAAAAANTAKTQADEAKVAANNAATYATETANTTKAEVLNTLGILVPTGLSVEAPARLTLGNTVKNVINAILQPVTAMKNIIFISDNEAVKVAPDGKITILRTGVSEVHVIPTCNTALAKTVAIQVTAPTMRLVNTRTRMRFTQSGAIRLN